MGRRRKNTLAERQAVMKAKYSPSCTERLSMAEEEYYSRNEVARILSVHPDTVTRIAKHEPGVLNIGSRGRRHLRIPKTVLYRLKRRMGVQSSTPYLGKEDNKC